LKFDSICNTTEKAGEHPETAKMTSSFASPRRILCTDPHHHQGIPLQRKPTP